MALPIYLIGARGCGKTTTGQRLAHALNLTFCDTDRYLQHVSRRTVAEIVAKAGWESFRQQETAALHAVTRPDAVIATGGGMILAAENCRFMRQNGQVIYLCAPASILASRLAASPDRALRPTLTGRSVIEEVDEVLAVRGALYQRTAHLTVDAAQPASQVVAAIMRLLAQAQVE